MLRRNTFSTANTLLMLLLRFLQILLNIGIQIFLLKIVHHFLRVIIIILIVDIINDLK